MLIRHLVSCRGTDEFLGVNDRVTFINSTLGKALGGAAGTEFVLAFLMQGYTIKLKLKKLSKTVDNTFSMSFSTCYTTIVNFNK